METTKALNQLLDMLGLEGDDRKDIVTLLTAVIRTLYYNTLR